VTLRHEQHGLFLPGEDRLAEELERVAVTPPVTALALHDDAPDARTCPGRSDEVERSDVAFAWIGPEQINVDNEAAGEKHAPMRFSSGPPLLGARSPSVPLTTRRPHSYWRRNSLDAVHHQNGGSSG